MSGRTIQHNSICSTFCVYLYHFPLILFPIACLGFREKSENRAKQFLVGVSVSQGGASLALGCILLLLQSKFRKQNYGKLILSSLGDGHSRAAA